MLDTVILTIPKGSYSIRNPYVFSPPANILDGSGGYLVKCVNNPTSTSKKEGKYRPRLTLMKRKTKNGIEIPLKIEFSVAKMLYNGNNVDEVQESDFEAVVQALRKALDEMGVLVPSSDLRKARISGLHPSKNIELLRGYTSSFVITELSKIDVSKKMDLNRDSFRNNGHSLQFYTNSHSLVIYDKVHDLSKPNKRAINKDQNSLQQSLFEVLAKKEGRQILRMEARLTKRVKINSVFGMLGLIQNPTFENVFKKDVCQKILLYYWNELIKGKSTFIFEVENNPKKMFRKIFKNNPKISSKRAIYLMGLWTLSKEGIRDMRTIIESYATGRTWYRISKDLQLLDKISSGIYHDWVRQIEKSLLEFKPFRLPTDRQL